MVVCHNFFSKAQPQYYLTHSWSVQIYKILIMVNFVRAGLPIDCEKKRPISQRQIHGKIG